MNGRYRSMLVAGVGFMMTLLCAAVGGADSLIIGDAVESTTGGFRFPDGTTQTTAYTGGGGDGISLSSPNGSITVGGTSTAPTVQLNFSQTDALYAPWSGSANYAPASGSANYAPANGSANYVAKGGDTMTGSLGVTVGASATAISGTTTGFGKAGSFQINNSSSGSHALYVTTNGTGFGHSVYSYSTGLSRAGVFEINNAANGGETVLAMTNGSGGAVHGYTTGTGNGGIFDINNTSNSSDALFAYTNGNGRAGYFQINKAGNGSDALYATTSGSGNAGNFNGKVNVSGILTTAGFILTGGSPGTGKVLTSDVAGTASWQTPAGDSTKVARAGDTMTGPLGVLIGTSATAISASTTGLGKAGSFQISNSSSGSHALYVTTNGTGAGHSVYSYSTGLSRAGVFEINNAANGGETVLAMTNGSGGAVHGYTTGTGNGGIFDINNAANNSDALYIYTNGNGRAGYFQINKAGNGSDALYATTNGSGSAVKGYTTGSGYAGYFQGGAGLYVNGNLTVSGAGAMPVYNNSGTAQAAPHMVTGTVAVNGVGNVSLSGAAVFSSAASYTCTAAMQATSPAVSPVGVEYVSGTSFNLYSSAAANVSYICVGI